MDEKAVFLRQIRSRSAEHRRAFDTLYNDRLYGVCISILRQELDSLVRTVYLLSKPIDRRMELISASAQGHRWLQEYSRKPITDKEMVELTQLLHGWTRSVYQFGCAFIHLSANHDYSDRDPYLMIDDGERESILSHCRHYHGGPSSDTPTMDDFIPFLPAIMEKVSNNLTSYIRAIEGDEVTDFRLI